MPPFAKKSSGDSPSMRAVEWNALMDAAIAAKVREGGSADLGIREAYPTTIAKVQNTTGIALNRFDCVGLNGPIIRPDFELSTFLKQPAFFAVTLSAADHTNKWGILAEPLAPNKIGSCIVSGMAPCRVIPASVTGDRVGPVDGGYCLTQQQGGGGILVYRGVQPAPGQAGEPGASYWSLVRIVSDSPRFSGCRANLADASVPSGYSSGGANGYPLTIGDPALSGNTFDTDKYWQSGSPTILTVPSDGYYVAWAQVSWENLTNYNGWRVMVIEAPSIGNIGYVKIPMDPHSSTEAANVPTGTEGSMIMQCSTGVIPIGKGATLQVRVWQNSGATLNCGGDYGTDFGGASGAPIGNGLFQQCAQIAVQRLSAGF